LLKHRSEQGGRDNRALRDLEAEEPFEESFGRLVGTGSRQIFTTEAYKHCDGRATWLDQVVLKPGMTEAKKGKAASGQK